MAIKAPDDLAIIIIGGAPQNRDPVIVGTIEGSLGGREQFDWVDIHLALDPPAFGDPDINVTHTFNHLHLHLEFDLLA